VLSAFLMISAALPLQRSTEHDALHSFRLFLNKSSDYSVDFKIVPTPHSRWVYIYIYPPGAGEGTKNDFANPTRRLSPIELSYVPDSAQLAVLVDSQGVYTVRGVKPSTKYPNDGKIEYRPFWGYCYKGGKIYWVENFHKECEGGVSAGQPRVLRCINCTGSS
jgi:hypothetical protein